MSSVKSKAGQTSLAEWNRLRARLDELEATVTAIRRGDVDAIVVDGPQGSRIFTLRSPEDPYRVLAERMSEGAATLTGDGTIVFCNQRLAEMMGVPAERLLGSSLATMLREPERTVVPALLAQTLLQTVRRDVYLLRGDGSTVPVLLSLSSVPLEGSEQGFCLVATDLSDRKQAEEAILRAAAIVDSTDDGIISKTLDGTVISWNRGAETIYGYSQQAMVGQPISRLLPPDRLEEFESIVDRIKQGQRIHHYETVRLRKDGQPVNVSLTVSPMKDAAGDIVGASTIARDITERVVAEEKIRKAAQYARSLIEASLDPLVTISREGKITDVNQATEDVTGVPRKRLIGSDFCDYFTEPEKAREGYEKAFSAGAVQDYPLAIRHTSGEVRDVLYNASVFWNEEGEIDGVFAAARDITERKSAEERLHRVNRTLHVLSESTEALIKATDEPEMLQHVCDTVVDVGGYAMAWVGYARDDEDKTVQPASQAGFEERYLQGTNISWADVARGRGPTGTAIRDGQVVVCSDMNTDPRFLPWREDAACLGYRSSIALPLRDESRVFGALTIYSRETGVFDEREQRLLEELANNVSYAIMMLRAQILRKQAEEEIHKLNQDLEQRVEARTGELLAANKDLEAFTYSVSHDLRAPLRHISGFSKILMEEFAPSLPPEAQRHLQRIEQGTHRMGQLVDDLLNLARVGRLDVNLHVTGLESLVREVIVSLEPDCVGREVEWRVGSLPFVECDTALMKQVFQNLLSNALKFTRPRTPAIIEVAHSKESGAPVFYVRDNGVGFGMKYADKLFGVFQRLHRAEDFEGTGVGLATVQRIIHKHGGRIWAEAELDKGASFYFTLGESEAKQPPPEEALIGAQR